MGTELGRRGSRFTAGVLMKTVVPLLAVASQRLKSNSSFRTTAKSAADILSACFERETSGGGGGLLYLNGSVKHETSKESRDEKKRQLLWSDSLVFAGIGAGETALVGWR
jgi:hypothetical protein